MLFHVARLFAFSVIVALLNLGCALGVAPLDGERGRVGEATEDYITANSLLPSALIPVKSNPDALDPSVLPALALTPDALAAAPVGATLQDPGAAGDLSRMFMKYLVGCALDGTQSFSFAWTDTAGNANSETYQGGLGIAPDWAAGPLDGTLTPLLSACLAARTNYFGVEVWISARSVEAPLQTAAGDLELAAYPHVEGAFWGNVFTLSPQVSACYAAADVLIAQADMRVCAAGLGGGSASPCGPITSLGDCSQVCGALTSGQYYAACTDQSGAPSDAVITTALP